MDINNNESASSTDVGNAAGTATRMKKTIADKAAEAKETISDLGRKAVDKLEESRHSTAGALEKTASTLHSGSDQLSGFGHSAADRLQATADYVRETDLKGIGQDIQHLVKQYPIQSLAAAAVLGFLVARGLRSSD